MLLTLLSNNVSLILTKDIRQCMKAMGNIRGIFRCDRKEQVMERYKLGEMEEKFAELIWEKAPIRTGELTKLCQQAFDWKRTTTYTMLKRLCERGLFANEDGLVVICMKREDFQAARGEQFIEENFEGSLPMFLAAFTRRKKLGEQEIQILREMIDNYEED